MSYQFIEFKIEESVAFISLNRPDVLNSFNRKMAVELQAVLALCSSDDGVRAVLLTGSGRAFSAGQDLAEAMEPGASIAEIVKKQYNPLILQIRQMEKPVVCAVNGVAAGAGANLAFACDITIASRSASFIQSFSKIGLIPDSGGTFFVPRLAGFQRAMGMMVLGDKINAETALQYGLIFQVSDDDKMMADARAMAVKLSSMPTAAIGLTKRALNKSLSSTLEEQLQTEAILQEEAGKTYDFKEGVQAFIEKRKAIFKGK
jgi:2-(1,2-epoxy-1,2-dihydrophenyl)acetyl-CoA isomerase